MKLHCPFCGTVVAVVLNLPGRDPGCWFAVTAERFPENPAPQSPRRFLLRLLYRQPGIGTRDVEVFSTREHPGLCEGHQVIA